MNYFELFDSPVSLNIDKSKLAKKYFELQKKYHPDFYTQADEAEQETDQLAARRGVRLEPQLLGVDRRVGDGVGGGHAALSRGLARRARSKRG